MTLIKITLIIFSSFIVNEVAYCTEQVTVNSPVDGFLALRSDPSVRVGTRISKIPSGTNLEITECINTASEGQWCKTKYADWIGWVSSKYVLKQITKDTEKSKQTSVVPEEHEKTFNGNDSAKTTNSNSIVEVSEQPQSSLKITANPQVAEDNIPINTVDTATSINSNAITNQAGQVEKVNGVQDPPLVQVNTKERSNTSQLGEKPVTTNKAETPEASLGTEQASLSSTVDGKKLSTITVEGYGEDADSALKNATSNGLMLVVGSFIDQNKVLKKNSAIVNGIREETKSLSTRISEYSQGTIQAIKVLSLTKDDKITKVTAEVTVRIDDFKAYVKEIAEAGTDIPLELLASMDSHIKQGTNKTEILVESVLRPIRDGKSVALKTSTPVAYRQWLESANSSGHASPSHAPQEDLRRTLYGHKTFIERNLGGIDDVVVIKIDVQMSNDLLLTLKKTMDSISDDKINAPLAACGGIPKRLPSENDLFFLLIKADATCDFYQLNDIKQKLVDYGNLPILDPIDLTDRLRPGRFAIEPYHSRLEIHVLDEKNNALQDEFIDVASGGGMNKTQNIVAMRGLDGFMEGLANRDLWLLGPRHSASLPLLAMREATENLIFIKLNDRSLRGSRKINASITVSR